MLQSDRSHFAFLYNTEKEELESLEKISAQTKINLSRMKNRLAEIDFSFGAEQNDILLSPEADFTSSCITVN